MTDIIDARDRMRAEQAKKNRELMPNLAALVDEIRKDFPDCKLVYGEDLVTGHTVGKKPDESNAFTIPPNYFPSREINLKRGR